MSEDNLFLRRVIAARRAAWIVLVIGIAFQILTYFIFLGMTDGGMDGLLESGLYGDISRDEASRLLLYYVSAMKLINYSFFLGAMFLTLWVRGLRRI